jgi:hypothetical protein
MRVAPGESDHILRYGHPFVSGEEARIAAIHFHPECFRTQQIRAGIESVPHLVRKRGMQLI